MKSFAVAVLWGWGGLSAVSPVEAAPRGFKRQPRTEHVHPCPRTLSRVVRRRLSAQIRKTTNRKGGGIDRGSFNSTSWPAECPLSPYVDLFGWQENNKSTVKSGKDDYKGPSKGEWQCGYSGKVFKHEHYIDLHMERMYESAMPENGVCLADYCTLFDACGNVSEPSFFETLAAEPPPCDPIDLERQKSMCHSVMDRCLRDDGSETAAAQMETQRAWCDQLTCESKTERHLYTRKCNGMISIIVIVLVVFICLVCKFAVPDEQDTGRRPRRRPARMNGMSNAAFDRDLKMSENKYD